MRYLALATAWLTAAGTCLALARPPQGEIAKDAAAAGLAFVELRTERSSYYVNEPIHVVVRFGFDPQFQQANLVPMFRPPMDLPVQIEWPWLEALEGTTAVAEREAASDEGQSFVLNETLTRARVVETTGLGGQASRTFEFERSWLPTRPGELILPEVRMRFAYATRFGARALQDNSAQDHIEAVVKGTPRSLNILPLPESGRPPGFSGAVGRLRMRAEVSEAEIELNSSVRLTLWIEGDGNLESFEAPRIDPGDAWRVLGSLQRRRSDLRMVAYDLQAVSSQATRVPQVEFVYFDTTPPAGYRTLQNEATPIAVRVPPGTLAGPVAPEKPSGSGLPQWIWSYAAAAAVIVGAALLLRFRRVRARS